MAVERKSSLNCSDGSGPNDHGRGSGCKEENPVSKVVRWPETQIVCRHRTYCQLKGEFFPFIRVHRVYDEFFPFIRVHRVYDEFLPLECIALIADRGKFLPQNTYPLLSGAANHLLM